MAVPQGYRAIPGSARRFLELATGREVSRRTVLDLQRQAQGFASQAEFARLSAAARGVGKDQRGIAGKLSTEYARYQITQLEGGKTPTIRDFLERYKAALADRDKRAGGAFEQYMTDIGRGPEGPGGEGKRNSPRSLTERELEAELDELLDEEEGDDDEFEP